MCEYLIQRIDAPDLFPLELRYYNQGRVISDTCSVCLDIIGMSRKYPAV